MKYPETDLEFEDKKVVRVDGRSITTNDGWSFRVKEDSQIEPEVGMTARFYGEGIGRPVRGLFLDGIEVFYKTVEQEEEERKKWLEDYAIEEAKRKLEPKNPEPQIEGFEWSDDMGEISGFGGGYEKTCRTMVSQGCKWWSEHPEAGPSVKGFKGIYGVASAENDDAKELEKAMMKGIDDCTGAMRQASLGHIFGWKRYGSWEAYKEESIRRNQQSKEK